jgi:cell division protein FtsB
MSGLPFSAFMTMIFLGLLAVCVTAGAHTRAELNAATQTKLELEEQVRKATFENAKLHKEIQELSANPHAIERAARKMGMVKADEMVIVITPKSR